MSESQYRKWLRADQHMFGTKRTSLREQEKEEVGRVKEKVDMRDIRNQLRVLEKGNNKTPTFLELELRGGKIEEVDPGNKKKGRDEGRMNDGLDEG